MRNRFVQKLIYALLLVCMPLTVSADNQSDYQYVYPIPQSTRVARNATIIIRLKNVAPSNLVNLQSFIQITGSKSNELSGNTKIASDEKTIIFDPQTDFEPGEVISVTITPELRDNQNRTIQPKSYTFTVTPNSAPARDFIMPDERDDKVQPALSKPDAVGRAMIMPNGVSVPSDFPHIDVFVDKNPGNGYIFINNWRNEGPYNIIFDNDGSPVWYHRFKDGDRRRDFKVQDNGTITMLARRGGHRFVNYDINFNQIDEFRPADPYHTDEHGVQVLENGNFIIIGRNSDKVDMSQYVAGGQKNADVRETCIQEFTPDHEKILEFRAWDHFDIRNVQLDNLTGGRIRFPHMNAVDVDEDGHVLLSSRHLSEVTKIHRQTGEIIWRLGGAHSDFEFVNDDLDGFRNQHDIRAHGNNHYTVFDNGNLHNPHRSRAVEYELDLDKMTATLVWEYRNPPGTSYSHYMGNAQRLPNGNTLINWAVGDRPKASEVTPDGEVVYEMNFVDGYHTYRTFRFPWDGVVEQPLLFVEQGSDNVTLVFNKFGDSDVDYYNIYGGNGPNPTTVMDTSKATLAKITGLPNDQRYYFRVTAVDNQGVESGFSNEEDIYVNLVSPGDNMARNGDFSNGTDKWDFTVNNADAQVQVTSEGFCYIDINNGGDDFWNVQLKQENIPIVRGEKYVFEFDAYSESSRAIDAKIERAESPYENYGKINPTPLGRTKKHYSYEFLMENPSDYKARIVFNCGGAYGDVYIDNVSLKNIDDDLPLSELSAPWMHRDIGQTSIEGDAGIWQDRYVIKGSGDDIWGDRDEFHYAYQRVEGNVELSARVFSISDTHEWAKAGVMIRNSLHAAAKHAMMCATVNNGMAFQRRTEKNAGSDNTNRGDLETPYWIKLVRRGNIFTGYESSDGESWDYVDSERIDMNETVYIGLAVTAHNDNALCEAHFDHFQIVNDTSVQNGDETRVPDSFELYPAYPNPFNSSTTLSYFVPVKAHVKLRVFNVRGEEIAVLANGIHDTGHHEEVFNASDMSTGIYFYEMKTRMTGDKSSYRAVKKMIFVK